MTSGRQFSVQYADGKLSFVMRMVQLIEKSRNFIYIENQFFVSAFGCLGVKQASCHLQLNSSKAVLAVS
jgi:hypothetical protein